MKYLIVNGDDFGATHGINRGILEAHRNGILTSASLFVDRPGSAEAAELARNTPSLSVGLHADLDGTPGDGVRKELLRQLERFVDLLGAQVRARVTRKWADAHGATLAKALEARFFSGVLEHLDGLADDWTRTAARLEETRARLA